MDLWISSRLAVRLHICKCNAISSIVSVFTRIHFRIVFYVLMSPSTLMAMHMLFLVQEITLTRCIYGKTLVQDKTEKLKRYGQVVVIHMMSRCHVNWFSQT